jgi:hypothetical protein
MAGKSKNQFSLFSAESSIPIMKKDFSDTKSSANDAKSSIPVTKSPLIESSIDWQMRRWVEFVTPAWRKVLAESIQQGDKDREKYARWILNTVLGVGDC